MRATAMRCPIGSVDNFRASLETAEYRLLAIWRIEVPLEAVYAAATTPRAGRTGGRACGKWSRLRPVTPMVSTSVIRYFWQGRLPYQMVFEVCATRIEKRVALEGTIHGDLEGVGRWHFNNEGAVSVVRYEWYVRSTRWWMNLIAPFARSVFIRNHGIVMRQGAGRTRGSAQRASAGTDKHRLDGRSVTAGTVPPRIAAGPFLAGPSMPGESDTALRRRRWLGSILQWYVCADVQTQTGFRRRVKPATGGAEYIAWKCR